LPKGSSVTDEQLVALARLGMDPGVNLEGARDIPTASQQNALDPQLNVLPAPSATPAAPALALAALRGTAFLSPWASILRVLQSANNSVYESVFGSLPVAVAAASLSPRLLGAGLLDLVLKGVGLSIGNPDDPAEAVKAAFTRVAGLRLELKTVSDPQQAFTLDDFFTHTFDDGVLTVYLPANYQSQVRGLTPERYLAAVVGHEQMEALGMTHDEVVAADMAEAHFQRFEGEGLEQILFTALTSYNKFRDRVFEAMDSAVLTSGLATSRESVEKAALGSVVQEGEAFTVNLRETPTIHADSHRVELNAREIGADVRVVAHTHVLPENWETMTLEERLAHLLPSWEDVEQLRSLRKPWGVIVVPGTNSAVYYEPAADGGVRVSFRGAVRQQMVAAGLSVDRSLERLDLLREAIAHNQQVIFPVTYQGNMVPLTLPAMVFLALQDQSIEDILDANGLTPSAFAGRVAIVQRKSISERDLGRRVERFLESFDQEFNNAPSPTPSPRGRGETLLNFLLPEGEGAPKERMRGNERLMELGPAQRANDLLRNTDMGEANVSVLEEKMAETPQELIQEVERLFTSAAAGEQQPKVLLLVENDSKKANAVQQSNLLASLVTQGHLHIEVREGTTDLHALVNQRIPQLFKLRPGTLLSLRIFLADDFESRFSHYDALLPYIIRGQRALAEALENASKSAARLLYRLRSK
ncbi:MAG: hypothetical protein HY548_07595, partial [Elusimicrobia bacterium]|nr:hypothetical protein [Elusimicrobiota bacterium]